MLGMKLYQLPHYITIGTGFMLLAKEYNLRMCKSRLQCRHADRFWEEMEARKFFWTSGACRCIQCSHELKGWEPEWSIPQLNLGNDLKCPKNEKKKMVYPLLPKCSNFQITEFSPALETDFESIFVSGGYNQGGRGLDHFASEPFNFCILVWMECC